jgi:uridine kinase
MSFVPTIIVIAGGTASGKTSIASTFASKHDCLLIHHDRYYKDIEFPPDANFDEPDALDNTLLASHIALLKQGLSANLPIYHFPTHRRLPTTDLVHPKPLIIVEGILTLAISSITELGDIKVFVDAPDDIRLVRRLQRDVVERGRDVNSVLEQYMHTVRPMHLLHIAPSKKHADLILDGEIPLDLSLAQLEKHIFG